MALTDGQVAGIGAGISGLTGVGGLISGLIGSKRNLQAVRESNEMNYRIAQMNNDFNKEMMERQMAYNLDMWNKENEYNSASNQRKRLEEAGLNPYLMMSGGNAGTASSVGGINPPSAQPVTMQPEVNNLGQIGSALMNMANPMMAFAQIRKINAEARSAGASADVAESSVDTDIALKDQELILSRATTQQVIYQNLISDVNLSWLNAEKMVSLSNMMADTFQKRWSGVLTARQADHELAKNVETWCRINGIVSENKIKAVQARVAESSEEYWKMREQYDALSTKQNYLTGNPWSYLFQPSKLFAVLDDWEKTIEKLKSIGANTPVGKVIETISEVPERMERGVNNIKKKVSDAFDPSGIPLWYWPPSWKYFKNY